MSEKTKKKRSAISWVAEFAGQKKLNYIFSVLFATAKVICGLMPYVYMADIVKRLLALHREGAVPEMSEFSKDMLMMAVFWTLSRICHSVSTTLSHAATFEVLANIRRRLTIKLSKIPLGSPRTARRPRDGRREARPSFRSLRRTIPPSSITGRSKPTISRRTKPTPLRITLRPRRASTRSPSR